jgi:PAS domain S-box-containing protein
MRIFRFLLTDRKHPAWRVVRFVTGRGQSEQAARLRRLADFNTFLVKIYQVVDTAQDETILMQAVCDMAVRYAHLRVAHILRPGNDQRFVRLALSGPRWWGEQQTPTIAVDHPELHGSAGRAWHSGKPVFSLSFDQTSYLAPWRELARRYGLRANASLPIFRDGKVWAVLSVCDAERGTFDSRLQVILEEAAQAISRGLERLDSRRINNALLDKATVGIAVLRGGVVEKNNICLEQLCGVGKGEMAGRSIRDFYASDDDFTRVRTAYEQLWRDGRVNVAAVRVARAEGTLVIADLTGVPLGRAEDQSSVWTVEDVTRRDMNQRLYRGLLSASDAMRRGRGEMDKTRGVCEALVRDTFYNGVVVTRVDEDGLLQIVTCAGPGTTDLETSPLHATQEQRQRSLAWRVWASRASVYDNDLLADCEPRQRCEEMRARHWRAILATPVWRGDTLWGVMSFISPM